MQIIKAGYEIFNPVDGANTLRKIEQVARVCYKSEDKIGSDSHKLMIRALIKNKHYAMLEHGSVIFEMDGFAYEDTRWVVNEMRERAGVSPFLRFTSLKFSNRNIVSGNLRSWVEFLEACIELELGVNGAIFNLLYISANAFKYATVFEGVARGVVEKACMYEEACGVCKELFVNDLSEKELLIHGDLTVKFIVDRGVSHEIVRHRVASFAQESTRYCNYGSKGGEITVIKPLYLTDCGEDYNLWKKSCIVAERQYIEMLAYGLQPQEARAVLPNSLKTEVVMTANLREWRHFFSLRACGATGKPHPQMLEVAVPLLQECKKLIPVVFDDLEPMEI